MHATRRTRFPCKIMSSCRSSDRATILQLFVHTSSGNTRRTGRFSLSLPFWRRRALWKLAAPRLRHGERREVPTTNANEALSLLLFSGGYRALVLPSLLILLFSRIRESLAVRRRRRGAAAIVTWGHSNHRSAASTHTAMRA